MYRTIRSYQHHINENLNRVELAAMIRLIYLPHRNKKGSARGKSGNVKASGRRGVEASEKEGQQKSVGFFQCIPSTRQRLINSGNEIGLWFGLVWSLYCCGHSLHTLTLLPAKHKKGKQ
jgi:hypothetical protein